MALAAQQQIQLFVGLNSGLTGQPLSQKRVDKVFDKVVAGLCAEFGGFTLTNGTGFWEGKPEASIILTVITDRPDAVGLLIEAAEFIKKHLEQQAVLLSVSQVATLLV